MKKLFTLLFVFGAAATSFAQTREEAKDIILGKKKETNDQKRPEGENRPAPVIIGDNGTIERPYPGGTGNSERSARIAEVNREYDAKIASIRNNPTLSEEEKSRAIAQLNKDRARKIRDINNSYGKVKDRKDRDDRDDDDDDDNKDDKKGKAKKAKGNNGNHYGWEKGKGNPHKNGGKPGKKG